MRTFLLILDWDKTSATMLPALYCSQHPVWRQEPRGRHSARSYNLDGYGGAWILMGFPVPVRQGCSLVVNV